MSEKKILLRLDTETYNKVHEQSKKENRSVNGELVNIIQKSFDTVTISGADLINISSRSTRRTFQEKIDAYHEELKEGK